MRREGGRLRSLPICSPQPGAPVSTRSPPALPAAATRQAGSHTRGLCQATSGRSSSALRWRGVLGRVLGSPRPRSARGLVRRTHRGRKPCRTRRWTSQEKLTGDKGQEKPCVGSGALPRVLHPQCSFPSTRTVGGLRGAGLGRTPKPLMSRGVLGVSHVGVEHSHS